MDDERYEPEEVSTDASTGLSIRWADGHTTTLTLGDVRVSCPCALCNEIRDKGEPVWPRDAGPASLEVLEAQLVGSYGIRFHWSDGHQAGIYSWEALRGRG